MRESGCPAPLFDSHVHLTDPQFDADREAVLARAAAAGVSRLVEIGDCPKHWSRVLAFARARPKTVRCALGLHPYYADQYTDELLSRLAEHSLLPEVVAIGEIGLDYTRASVPAPVQTAALRRILAACRRWEKPVVIHCRDAYADLRAIVAEIFPSSPPPYRFWGVVHCFSGSPDDAAFLAAAGFALGADGPITYPKNSALRAAFLRIGPDHTVLETDSPYLPPQTRRGQRNEPAAATQICAALAELWGMPGHEAAQIATRNALALYRLG
ncbi:MAG TPA: hydrolase TatD [Elusimicrobia bacterium]|nr:hydrolase TatD [Elusimicrobiota bacterium]HBT61839.1 hydrolase TatD [Elusimicrobiota bacterium]